MEHHSDFLIFLDSTENSNFETSSFKKKIDVQLSLELIT